MILQKATVYNYKSFDPAGQSIVLGTGFNVLFGQNNAGKTALLEALALQIENKPHRSRSTIPGADVSRDLGESIIEFTFTIDRHELWTLLRQAGQFFVPLPRVHDYGLSSQEPEELLRFCEWALDQTPLTLMYTCKGGNLYTSRSPSFGLYAAEENPPEQISIAVCTVDAVENKLRTASASTSSRNNELGSFLASTLRSRVYLFKAERRIGRSNLNASEELSQDASNLASVLNRLQANPTRFQRFSSLVKQVFPAIEAISVRPTAGNELEILIWFDEPIHEREDLAVPVSEAGTGTGQVLAILYVAMTASTSRTLIVDEPQNFLHPGAVRNLIQICKQFNHHQFVFATHSPAVIMTAAPTTLHQIRLEGRRSTVVGVDPQQSESLKVLLQDIGASLAEVFGSDRILWVEGATEELCFPLILDAFGVAVLGTVIAGVKSTGQLEGREAEAVFAIYDKLSSSALLPPALAFVFDSEARSAEKKVDLAKRSGNKLRFLPLPMFENYLLVPEALANVMNGISEFREKEVQPGEVAEWLEKHAQKLKINKNGSLRESIHGAKALSMLFADLSESRVEYRKVDHGVALTRWVLVHQKAELADLAEFLKQLLEPPRPTPLTN